MSAPIQISPLNVQTKLQVPSSTEKDQKQPKNSVAATGGANESPSTTPPECALIATPSRRRRTRRRLRASESCSREFQDEYEFIEGEQGIIGAGAYAVVRIATHRRTGEQFAVKVIDKNNRNNTKEKCMNEARLLHQVSGFKNIVKLHDFKEDKDNFYMVFEYVQGGNLQAQLDARGGTLEEEEVTAMVRDLANALHFLHSRRIAHRDLKPANILCERSNFVSPCKLADFDLASAEHISNNSNNYSAILNSPPSPTSGTNINHSTYIGAGSHTNQHHANSLVPLEIRKSTTSNMDSGIDACSPTGMETGSPKASWGDNNQQHKMECVFEDEVLHSKRNIEPPMEMQSPVGSPEYMPPEIATLFLYGNGCYDEEGEEDGFDHVVHEFDRSYTQACDIWSLGVIAYVALCGKPPFAAIREHCNNVECKWNEGGACEQCQGSLFEEIYYANLQFSDPKWKEISSEAKHLISRCLDRNASTRISAYEILEHPFLQRLSRPNTNTSSSKPTTNATTTTTEVDGTVNNNNKEFNHTGSSETKINNNNNNTRVVKATTSSSLLSEKFNSCCSLTETQLKELARCQQQQHPPRSKRQYLDEECLLEDSDSGNCEHLMDDGGSADQAIRHHHHNSHTGPVTLKVPGHPQVVRPFYPPRDRIRYDSWDGRFE